MNPPPRQIRRVRRSKDWEAWALLGLGLVLALPFLVLVMQNLVLIIWGKPTEAVVMEKITGRDRGGLNYSLKYRYGAGNRQFIGSDYVGYSKFTQANMSGPLMIRQIMIGEFSYSTAGASDERAWDLVEAYGLVLLICSPILIISIFAGPFRLIRDRWVARNGVYAKATIISWRTILRGHELHWIRYSFATQDGRTINRLFPYLVVAPMTDRTAGKGDPIDVLYLPSLPRINMPMDMSAYLPASVGNN